MSTKPPPYIAQAQIQSLPLDFAWDGATAHSGPAEKVTKLLRHLSGITTCGQITMCAGVLEWGAWRLKGHAPVEHNFELAEAAFAYQVDNRYVDRDRGPKGRPPDDPPALSAIMELNKFMRDELSVKKYWNSYYTPVTETFHSAHLVRYVLPASKRKLFDGWLNTVVDRLKSVAPKPEEEFKKKKEFDSIDAYNAFVTRHRGDPLPPEILDPGFDYKHEQRFELIDQFLQSLDCEANRYLRSPDEMKEMGFEGTPYTINPSACHA